MNNIEEKLNKLKLKGLTNEEKDSLWGRVVVSKIEEGRNSKKLLFNIFNFTMNMNKMIVGGLALVVVIASTGVVVASNGAHPGDALFPVELAMEKVQLNLAPENKKAELKLKFTEERVSEIQDVVTKRSSGGDNTAVVLSDKENDDVATSLTDINAFLETNKDMPQSEELRKKFTGILTVLGDDKNVRIERKDGEIKIKSDGLKIEVKNGDKKEVKIENNNTNDNSGPSKTEASKTTNTLKSLPPPTDDEDDDGDIKEGDDEEFCRGEWRDAKDCNASSDSNSGRKGDDFEEEEDD